ncbi:Fic family protein [Flagellimonas abyssi]|jgi:Fic family protein|uniref:Fic family protein n=1 Tax=Flagellimonas abyssi TaxID=2864871 RepID=A0ABS7ERG4_9FLAO|nr:Fic family protein [Allomuricauda abyssi]MBW8200188.1 Fic family protein [Allomuricauda abyssi]
MRNDLKELIDIKERYLELSKGVLDYDKFNQYAITHHSTVIEGSTLSLEETFILLDKGLTPNNRPLEHSLMATDHLKALKLIIEWAKSKKILESKDIRELSAIIMKGTGSKISTMAGDFDSSKGDFRKATVRNEDRIFMDHKVPGEVDRLMRELSLTINGKKDFVGSNLLAFDIHFQMVSIHPFADGNGRLSRLLMNYVQLFHDHPMTVVFPEDRRQYFDALENTRRSEDISIFRNFMLNQAKKYFEREIGILSKEQKRSKSKDRGISFIF